MTAVTLVGYGPSVYTRAVRLALMAAKVRFDWIETDPFDPASDAATYHPFGRVPVLRHGDVSIYETAAILTYVEGVFADEPRSDPLRRARAAQVAAIVDHYAYWPLVRQVFVEGVLAPLRDRAVDAAALAAGMAAASPVLDALEAIAAEGLVLNAAAPGRADWHLLPILDTFALYGPGAKALADRPHVEAWLTAMRALPVVRDTAPVLGETR